MVGRIGNGNIGCTIGQPKSRLQDIETTDIPLRIIVIIIAAMSSINSSTQHGTAQPNPTQRNARRHNTSQKQSRPVKTEKAHVTPQPIQRRRAGKNRQEEADQRKGRNDDAKRGRPAPGTPLADHGCLVGVEGKEGRGRFQGLLRRVEVRDAVPPVASAEGKGRQPASCASNDMLLP